MLFCLLVCQLVAFWGLQGIALPCSGCFVGFVLCLLLARPRLVVILKWLVVVSWLCCYFFRLLSELASAITLVCQALLLAEEVYSPSLLLHLGACSPPVFSACCFLHIDLVKQLGLQFISGNLSPMLLGDLFLIFVYACIVDLLVSSAITFFIYIFLTFNKKKSSWQ